MGVYGRFVFKEVTVRLCQSINTKKQDCKDVRSRLGLKWWENGCGTDRKLDRTI